MSLLPNPLPITPFTRPVRGEVALPGSKSLTNRALLLGALCDGSVTLAHALASEDTDLMAAALNLLGIPVTSESAAGTIRIAGQAGRIPVDSADLLVGNAGTAARFLTAYCAAAAQGVYRLDGVPQMRRRPMRGLIEALRAIGADIRCRGKEGFLPLEIRARGLRGGTVAIDARESSQMLSALLMIAPLCPAPLDVTIIGDVRWPFVQMTARLMEHFGQPPLERHGENTFLVPNATPYHLEAAYAIEPDATTASYFLALPLVAGGHIQLPGLRPPGCGLQGDTQFISVLERIGLTATSQTDGAGIEVIAANDAAGRGVTQDFRGFSDTFLTLAALAPLLTGPTRITGIGHTRRQETDRVAGAARQLRKLGQEVVEEEDALMITPRPLPHDVEIETYGDHRFAMSFAILGSHDLRKDGQPWLSVRDPGCCAKTFPDFFGVLDRVWRQSHSLP
jgi:3-phosphoshikimate 1-carboxyvinyltransferase